MIAILSPAKSLDFDTPPKHNLYSTPALSEDSEYLVKKLSKMSKRKVGSLMHLSDQLAELNYNRYQNWNFGSDESSKQAIYAFTGDVYRGLKVEEFNKADIEYAQNHLRILSGLYGLLRPMDLIQPYRLEMGTKWPVTTAKNNLYKYWGDKITNELNASYQAEEPKVLVNLASNEYFKAVNPKAFDGKIVNITFKENKDGQYKIVAIFAKIARGMFARFMMQNRINDINMLKLFSEEGYAYHESLSSENELVFTR